MPKRGAINRPKLSETQEGPYLEPCASAGKKNKKTQNALLLAFVVSTSRRNAVMSQDGSSVLSVYLPHGYRARNDGLSSQMNEIFP